MYKYFIQEHFLTNLKTGENLIPFNGYFSDKIEEIYKIPYMRKSSILNSL
jgi:hypothetical protein